MLLACPTRLMIIGNHLEFEVDVMSLDVVDLVKWAIMKQSVRNA